MAKQRLSSADQLVMYKIVIFYCVRLCAILNLQFLLVFTAMLMLCYLLFFSKAETSFSVYWRKAIS
jgi:hypothetical protein